MEVLVSGSLAYDRIMDFPGRFSDHIMPDKLHMINVSFTVNGLKENFGGTAMLPAVPPKFSFSPKHRNTYRLIKNSPGDTTRI